MNYSASVNHNLPKFYSWSQSIKSLNTKDIQYREKSWRIIQGSARKLLDSNSELIEKWSFLKFGDIIFPLNIPLSRNTHLISHFYHFWFIFEQSFDFLFASFQKIRFYKNSNPFDEFNASWFFLFEENFIIWMILRWYEHWSPQKPLKPQY